MLAIRADHPCLELSSIRETDTHCTCALNHMRIRKNLSIAAKNDTAALPRRLAAPIIGVPRRARGTTARALIPAFAGGLGLDFYHCRSNALRRIIYKRR